MASRSLRGRLLGFAILVIIGALLLCWFALSILFERHVLRRIAGELDSHLRQLAALTELAPDGELSLRRPLSDPRFDRPASGLYWQVEVAGGGMSSRSLWDERLEAPALDLSLGEKHLHESVPFNESQVIVLEQRIAHLRGGARVPMRLLVAVRRDEARTAREEFGNDVLALIAALAVFLIAASAAQIVIGLRPLSVLRERLHRIGAGETPQVDGDYPSEVEELVSELNHLLEARAETIKKARARAGDLAHGLKTPLAILSAEGRRLLERGEPDSANEIERQVTAMNRQVEQHLARARARGPGGGLAVRTQLKPALSRLVVAMRRLPRGHELEWEIDLADDLECRFDPADFDDLAGNALDNARKWAKRRVLISAETIDGRLWIQIADDGPGVPADEMDGVLERGGRTDAATPGSGLGLAIMRDLLEIYGCELVIENLAWGGLQVRFSTP